MGRLFYHPINFTILFKNHHTVNRLDDFLFRAQWDTTGGWGCRGGWGLRGVWRSRSHLLIMFWGRSFMVLLCQSSLHAHQPLTKFILRMDGGFYSNFVKVIVMLFKTWQSNEDFLRELLRSCCRILAKRRVFWQQFRKESRTSLQQNPSVLKKENRLNSHQTVL